MDHWFAGHAVYKERFPHRVPGGKTIMRDLSKFAGEVICSFCDLQMPLKAVRRMVKYRFPVGALIAMLAGEMLDLDAVLEDFSWHMSKTSPANTRDTDLCYVLCFAGSEIAQPVTYVEATWELLRFDSLQCSSSWGAVWCTSMDPQPFVARYPEHRKEIQDEIAVRSQSEVLYLCTSHAGKRNLFSCRRDSTK